MSDLIDAHTVANSTHPPPPTNTNANNDSLISVVEDFLPPPSPTLTDFTHDSDGMKHLWSQALAISAPTVGLHLYCPKKLRKHLIGQKSPIES